MELIVDRDDPDELAIACTGEIDLRNYTPDPIASLLGPVGYGRRVTLDLSGVTFLESNAVAWLLNCDHSFRGAKGRFVIHSVPEFIERMFKLLNVREELEIEQDAAAASQRLRLPPLPRPHSSGISRREGRAATQPALSDDSPSAAPMESARSRSRQAEMHLIVIRDDPAVLMVRSEGEIRQPAFITLDPLADLLGSKGFAREVTLDLGGVTAIDNHGATWLTSTDIHIRNAGGRFVIHSIPANIIGFFKRLRLHEALEIEQDEAAALDRLRKPPRNRGESVEDRGDPPPMLH